MKHFPAARFTAQLEGLTITRASRSVSLTTAILVGATLFAAGFAAAVWTVGIIVTAP